MKYVVDGLFLTQRITGIQRYAIEIVKGLDEITPQGELEILIPKSTDISERFQSIEVKKYGTHKGILWEQIDLPRYLKKNKAKGIFLCNSLPVTYPHGIITIHDVCCKAHPEFFPSLRDKMAALWHRYLYFVAAESRVHILTDSFFSKSEIQKYYHVPDERISVIYCGWQHISGTVTSKKIFNKYPRLLEKDYFFSMSSIMPNKNYGWILNAARENPKEFFAIAGGSRLREAADKEGFSGCDNILFLGYVGDDEAKALMQECKALVSPTLYEGFGLTPLEAVASGCRKILISRIPTLVEIYGDNANYIDLNDSSYKLNELIEVNAEELLKKYSWTESAKALYSLLEKED